MPTEVPKQYKHHFAGRRYTSEFLGPGQWYVSTRYSVFPCRFTVMHQCFNACDNPQKENLSFFTISLQKLHAHFHTCSFMFICKLLWHPPYLKSLWIIKYADLQLMSNLAVSVTITCMVLNQSINWFSIFCHLWCGWIVQAVFISDACSAILEPFNPSVHLPLCNTAFSILC